MGLISVIKAAPIILALSILAGMLTAWLLYRVLLYDSDDFWHGVRKFTAGLLRRRRRYGARIPPEDFEDEGWSSGIRFFLLVDLSSGIAYLVYSQLHKHWG